METPILTLRKWPSSRLSGAESRDVGSDLAGVIGRDLDRGVGRDCSASDSRSASSRPAPGPIQMESPTCGRDACSITRACRITAVNESYGLLRDTGGILLDMSPDAALAERVRQTVESDGDRLIDLHLWRLGPGHLGAVLSVATNRQRGPEYYQSLLRRFRTLSHVTIEVQHS